MGFGELSKFPCLFWFRPFALMQKDQKIKAVRPRAKKGSCCLNCANSRGVCFAFVVKGVLRSNSAQFTHYSVCFLLEFVNPIDASVYF